MIFLWLATWHSKCTPPIPTGILNRVKSLAGISKQTLNMIKAGSIEWQHRNGGRVVALLPPVVALPPSSLVEFSTVELNLKSYSSQVVGVRGTSI